MVENENKCICSSGESTSLAQFCINNSDRFLDSKGIKEYAERAGKMYNQP